MSETTPRDRKVWFGSHRVRKRDTEKFEYGNTVEVFPTETYKVSDKLTIQAVPLEFSARGVLEAHGASIESAIRSSNGVIFEYFPEEIKKIESNPLVQGLTNVRLFMPYYEYSQDKAMHHQKDVFVFDPAHTLSFSVIRAIPTAFYVGGMWSAAAVEKNIGRIQQALNLSKNAAERTRKGAVVLTALFGIGGVLNGTARSREHLRQKPNTGFQESNFRRIIIAKGIQNLANQLDSDPNSTPKKLLLLYPPVHWKGIQEYLDNPKKLDRMFRIARAFGIGSLKKDYFTARHYEPHNGNWQLKEEKDIRL